MTEKFVLKEQPQESIITRDKIEAPPNFVSVFHETKIEFLPPINQTGLKARIESKGKGRNEEMKKRNKLIDQYLPENLKKLGLSRNNIYAYPFLERGHGLLGADRRFIKKGDFAIGQEFTAFSEGARYILKEMGVKTLAEYKAKVNDPVYLKNKYPGEVLEIKVDPEKCYVGDLEYIVRIQDLMDRGWTREDAGEEQAKYYWQKLITLKDFLKWYREPEWAEDNNNIKNAEDFKEEIYSASDYHLLKGAPDNLPETIYHPEILIPADIPQKHIKLVQ
ncbi:MAG: hypothetical protein WC460_02090 [Patescibacteria group bacterium]